MIEIDKNIIIETEHLGSNNAIVCTRDGVVLIDAPHRPSDAIKWRRVAESNGPIRYLINTDHHIDHTMCNIFLPGEIVSHEGTREKLVKSPPTRQYIDDLLDVIDPAGKMYLDEYSQRLPTITFSKSMELRVGGLEFQLTHYRGHTLNSALIYLPQQKIAFTGDLVCEAGLPAFIDADTFEWIETIRKIEAMDIRYIMPGHGKVCTIKEARVFRRADGRPGRRSREVHRRRAVTRRRHGQGLLRGPYPHRHRGKPGLSRPPHGTLYDQEHRGYIRPHSAEAGRVGAPLITHGL